MPAEPKILVVAEHERITELPVYAQRRGIPYFTLPITWRDFRPVVSAALSD